MARNPFATQQRLKGHSPKEQASAYERLYGLRENPFPPLALFVASDSDPRRNGEIYDDDFRRAEERDFFRKFVQPPGGEEPMRLGFIRLGPGVGVRGNGKSAFLNRIMRRINDQEWPAEWIVDEGDPELFSLAVHLLPEPRKQSNVFSLARLIFDTLDDRELFKKVDADLRSALLAKLLPAEQLEELASRPAEEVRAELQAPERFTLLLERLGLSLDDLARQVRSELGRLSPLSLSNPIVQGFLDRDLSLATLWSFWRGLGFTEGEHRWKRHGTEFLVNGLAPLLMLAGYQRLYVLLDEFEKIYMYQSAKKRDEFLDVLRQTFYERDSVAVRRGFFSTVLTVHPSIYEYLTNSWQRVGLWDLFPLDADRIPRQSVELAASTPAKLEHLLVAYLDRYRVPGDSRAGTSYPFEPGALEPAMMKAQLLPRGTLLAAHMVLRRAASEGREGPIGRAYVAELLETQVLDQEEDGDRLFESRSPDLDLKA